MRLRFAFTAALVVCLALPCAAAVTRTETVALVVSAEPRIAHLFDGPMSSELAKLENVAISTPDVANWIILVKVMPIKSGAGADIGYYAAAVTFLEHVRQLPSAAMASTAGALSAESLERDPQWVNALRDQVLLVVADSSIVAVCREIAMRFDSQVVTSLQERPVPAVPAAAIAPVRSMAPAAKNAANGPDEDAMLDDGVVGPPLEDDSIPSFTPPDRIAGSQPAAAKPAAKPKSKKADAASASRASARTKGSQLPAAAAEPVKPPAVVDREPVSAPTASIAIPAPAQPSAPRAEDSAIGQPVPSTANEAKPPEAVPDSDPSLPPERALLKTAGWFKPGSPPTAPSADPNRSPESVAPPAAAATVPNASTEAAAAPSPVTPPAAALTLPTASTQAFAPPNPAQPAPQPEPQRVADQQPAAPTNPSAALTPKREEKERSAAEFDAARMAKRPPERQIPAPPAPVVPAVSAPESTSLSSAEKTPATKVEPGGDGKLMPRRIGNTPSAQPMASVLEAARAKKKSAAGGTAHPAATRTAPPSTGATPKSGAAPKDAKTSEAPPAAPQAQAPPPDPQPSGDHADDDGGQHPASPSDDRPPEKNSKP